MYILIKANIKCVFKTIINRNRGKRMVNLKKQEKKSKGYSSFD